MSDHDTPHPVDRAYAEAETLLDNDAARRADIEAGAGR